VGALNWPVAQESSVPRGSSPWCRWVPAVGPPPLVPGARPAATSFRGPAGRAPGDQGSSSLALSCCAMAACSPQAHTVRYVDNTKNPGARSQWRYQKIFIFAQEVFDSGRVFWEMRTLCRGLQRTQKWEMSEFWRRRKARACEVLAKHGLHVTHVRPSLEAYRSLPVQEQFQEAREFLQHEYTISTEAMFALLFMWANEARDQSVRQEAQALIHDVLEQCFGQADSFWSVLRFPEERQADLLEMVCEDVAAGVRCRHVGNFVRMSASIDRERASNVVPWLLQVASCDCPRSWLWYTEMVQQISLQVQHQVVGSQSHFAASPEGIRMPRGAKRHLRLDTELRNTALEAVRGKRFKSQAWCQRGGAVQVPRTTAQNFEAQWLGDYIFNLADQAKDTRQLCLALDASVLGGEDTLVFAAWFPKTRKAGWLTPQALGGAGPC